MSKQKQAAVNEATAWKVREATRIAADKAQAAFKQADAEYDKTIAAWAKIDAEQAPKDEH